MHEDAGELVPIGHQRFFDHHSSLAQIRRRMRLAAACIQN
jgi:hypothetical protein